MDEATKVWTGVPKELADRWELIVSEVSKHLFETRKKMRTAVGKRPYKGLPVDEEELYNRWLSVRHDKDELKKILKDNVKQTPDGRWLLPNELVARVLKNERRAKDGGFDEFLPVEKEQ